VLQCVAACCSVLQCVAVPYVIDSNVKCDLYMKNRIHVICCIVILFVEILSCSVLQCVAVCCSMLQCVAVLHCNAMCCSVLQCVALCCSVLQCVAVCCSV